MIALFPASSLDNSILTSVLVGLLVVWLFQETLGWNFTGLVVPGYLASILTIHPVTGMVVVLEAVVTVALVLLTSERVPAWWPWTRLFGRDRFFLFLLASVAVRIALEGGGLALVRERLGFQVEDGLHSMGLVLVPLLANAIWRAGAGGAPRVAIPVLITWALLARFFVPVTNLSLSSFELTYEDLALDFVGSPRAYILLLVGAAMGSWANQRWGWDYGGIIVPGLLALCWLEPVNLAATLGEAVVIALLLQASLRLPFLRGANLTGGRPLVLAFALGYLAKFGMGWLFGAAWPGFAVRDLYGFGYLLSSIIALRIVKHGEPFRSIVPALVTSLGAFLTGSTLGWLLAVIWPAPEAAPEHDQRQAPVEGARALLTSAWRDAGTPPTEIGGVAAADHDAVLWGGDGFGALQVRANARPLAVVARLGPLAMDGAALAVAEALDARALLICGATGDACARARAQIAARLPVLLLEPGDADVLHVEGPLAAAVDLGRLGPLLGPFTLAGGEGHDTLVLSTATRVRVAAGRLGAEPTARPVLQAGAGGGAGKAGADLPIAAGASRATGGAAPGSAASNSAPPPDAAALRGFREMVLRPWFTTLRDEPWREDGLRLATGNAAALGFTLTREGDVSVLSAPGAGAGAAAGSSAVGPVAMEGGVGASGGSAAAAGVSDIGWRIVADAGGRPIVVVVPDVGRSPAARAMGRAIARAFEAALLVEDTSRAEQGDAATWTHAAVLAALEALGPAARVITVRAVPDTADPSADVVLSAGRYVAPGASAPALLEGLATRLRAAGLTVALYDGSALRLGFGDVGNPARDAARANAGAEAHATVYVTGPGARRLAPLDLSRPAGAALASLFPTRLTDLRARAEGAAPAPAPAAGQWRAALDVLLRAGRTGPLRALRDRAVAAGGGVALLHDPLLGTRWLEARPCGSCAVLLLALAPTEPGPTAPSASVAGAAAASASVAGASAASAPAPAATALAATAPAATGAAAPAGASVGGVPLPDELLDTRPATTRVLDSLALGGADLGLEAP